MYATALAAMAGHTLTGLAGSGRSKCDKPLQLKAFVPTPYYFPGYAVAKMGLRKHGATTDSIQEADRELREL